MTAPANNGPTISLCMIVKNEERYLRGCLESARPFVDEIIIVDTGSTDTTVAIAEEFGAKIFHWAWNGNFSDARNQSLSHATGDFILYLDADERLMNGAALRALRPANNVIAYHISIKSTHILPSGTVEQVNQYQRFFRRHPKVRFEGVVHEQILPSLLRMQKSIAPSDVFIEHLGYGESLEKIAEKCERNASLLRDQLMRNPNDTYAEYQLGNTLGVMQRYDEAEPHLLRAVEKDPSGSIRASASNILVEIAMHRQDLVAAEQWCRRSIGFVPLQVMAYWFLSGILTHTKKYTEALEHLHSVRRNTGRPTGLAHDLSIGEKEVQYRTLVCYEGLANEAITRNDFTVAEEWASAAEHEQLFSPKLQTIGIQSALALNHFDAVVRRIDRLLRSLPPEAQGQREKFTAIRSRIERLVPA